MNLLRIIESENQAALSKDRVMPKFAPGDNLAVKVKVVEGDRERLQTIEGVCIAVRRAGVNSSFTLRKISYGEGVEIVFPMYSPRLASVEVVRRGDVRRAKLYYLRSLRGKAARIDELRDEALNTEGASPEPTTKA